MVFENAVSAKPGLIVLHVVGDHVRECGGRSRSDAAVATVRVASTVCARQISALDVHLVFENSRLRHAVIRLCEIGSTADSLVVGRGRPVEGVVPALGR